MNVLFVSQCEKRALNQTRRILDQFAERRGERTWQTTITQEGLNTVRKLLRQTARKNSAVACHWIRGLDHSELLWVVGDAKQFNPQGAVPTNITRRNILRADDENDWNTLQEIRLFTVLSALLHDLGKASVAFQDRLKEKILERNQYRHEWVSLRLFQAFVGQDDDATWLARLADPSPQDDAAWLQRLQRDGLDELEAAHKRPFAALHHAPLAQAIGWLVVTHHRLPQEPQSSDGSASLNSEEAMEDVLNKVTAYWNENSKSKQDGMDGDDNTEPVQPKKQSIKGYWNIPKENLPVTTSLWRKRAARVAQDLQKLVQQKPGERWLDNPYVMHVSRLCLMLADHHYSSLALDDHGKRHQERLNGEADFPAYANTFFDAKKRAFVGNQPLDEHLLGVAQHGGEITHALPSLAQELPRLGSHKALKKPATDPRFRWQNKAAVLAESMRERAKKQGAFIVNLASTGCGKTLANARFMHALANPKQGMRCTFAMGLRTLTLQTGQAFKELLGLDEEHLAIRVGGLAQRRLFEYQLEQAEATGSASSQALLDGDSFVAYDGNADAHPLLRRLLHNPNDQFAKSLITAPLLVCTIDHLTPATESTRGGHQIAPMLRLMTSDLVLDEPDDFDINDLPALTRLVHWAGLLGSRVLLSSATLPPDLMLGLFQSYRHGRLQFERNRGEAAAAKASPICCAWMDEFDAQALACADGEAFKLAHEAFVKRRIASLQNLNAQQAKPARLAQLAKLDLSDCHSNEARLHLGFAQRVTALAQTLHQHHYTVDPHSGKRVSFGLVRMANIEPLVGVALALYSQEVTWPAHIRVHLCVYHSQYPLLLRSRIEQRLDAALNRKQPLALFDLPDIRQHLNAHAETDHLFIVLGSPVTEVGRDHDYDWAIVEPSSMRSLIQLAGRVRRHRPLTQGEALSAPNIRVFQYNLKHWREGGSNTKPCFVRPGFEKTGGKDFQFDTHDLAQLIHPLLDQQGQFAIDAVPRLLAARPLRPSKRLTDLEHARMQDQMLRASGKDALNAASIWHMKPEDATLTATLPRAQPFRYSDDHREEVDYRLMPNEVGDDFVVERAFEPGDKSKFKHAWVADNTRFIRLGPELAQGERISPWGDTDYLQALHELAESLDMPLKDCAKSFGTFTLREPENAPGTRWCFHPALGFTTLLPLLLTHHERRLHGAHTLESPGKNQKFDHPLSKRKAGGQAGEAER